MEEETDLSKLTLRIFSKLESKWLREEAGERKTRILAIDGGVGPDGLVAARALVRLESLLQSASGDASARIPHHFDLIAGTGLGGVLAAMITAGEPASLMSAAEAADLLLSRLPRLFRRRGRWRVGGSGSGSGSGRGRFSASSFEGVMRGVFKGMTLRDACRPLLVPCCDLASGAPLVFSRADAAESARFDFELWAVCRASAATPGVLAPCRVRSVDGGTEREAVGGGVVMNNPAGAAVTHVLHNRRDFPRVRGIGDLIVLSLGNGAPGGSDGSPAATPDRVMGIVLRGVSDTVDQILGNAFAWNRADYVRIQANGLVADEEGKMEENKKKKKKERKMAAEQLREAGERMMREKGLEALPFGGKQLLKETNAERMEALVRRLVAPTSAVMPLLLLPAPVSSPLTETEAVLLPEEGR